MKFYILLVLSTFIFSCSRQLENLNYPADSNEIAHVYLDQPDKETNEESAMIQELTKVEIEMLIKALETAKEVGPRKFIPKYYIIFETKTGVTLKLKVNENYIKGYDSDFTYEIDELQFLNQFGKE